MIKMFTWAVIARSTLVWGKHPLNGIPVKCIWHVRGVKHLFYPVCLVESIPVWHSLFYISLWTLGYTFVGVCVCVCTCVCVYVYVHAPLCLQIVSMRTWRQLYRLIWTKWHPGYKSRYGSRLVYCVIVLALVGCQSYQAKDSRKHQEELWANVSWPTCTLSIPHTTVFSVIHITSLYIHFQCLSH